MWTSLAALSVALGCGFAWEQWSRRAERTLEAPGRRLDVAGDVVHCLDAGQGVPTVVILHGMGDGVASWLPVHEALARRTRVVAWDRPGTGWSGAERVTGPTVDTLIDEVHQRLAALGVHGRCVLVGHSMGGLLARLYRQRFPDEVVGLVLVDSTHEDLAVDPGFRLGFGAFRGMLAALRSSSLFGVPRLLVDGLGIAPNYPKPAVYRRQVSALQFQQWKASVHRSFSWRGPRGEAAALIEVLAAARAAAPPDSDARSLGALPVAVLANPGFGPGWLALQRELAARSSRSSFRVSEPPGHSIQMLRPDLVQAAVEEVLELVHGGAGAPP